MSKAVVMIIGVLVLGLSLVIPGCARGGVSPEDFYRTNTIKFISPDVAGGAQDLFNRATCKYLQRSTGGTVVFENMPGGAYIRGTNGVWRAAPDGLTIGGCARPVILLNDMLDEPTIEWGGKSSQFTYLAAAQKEHHIFLVKEGGPYASIAGLQAGKGLKLGATSIRGNYGLGCITVAHVLGLDAKVLGGYGGSPQLALAIKQGEIAGAIVGTSAGIARIKEGGVKALFLLANERQPAVSDVPALTELVKLSGEKEGLIRLWTERLNVGNWIYGPPGIPEDRASFLRKAHSQIFKDPEAQKELQTISGYSPITFMTWEEALKIAKDLEKDKQRLRDTFLGLIQRYQT